MDLRQEILHRLEEKGEEDRPDDGAEYGAGSPENAHEHGIKGPVQVVKRLRLHVEEVVRLKCPAEARDKGADGKGEDLELQDIDAACLRGRLVFPDRDKGKANAGLADIAGHADGKTAKKEGDEVVGGDGA